MPRAKKSHQQQQPLIDDFPDPAEYRPDFGEEVAAPPRQARKKNRNAPSRPPRVESSSPEPAPVSILEPESEPEEAFDEPIAFTEPDQPPRRHPSLLSQITFPSHTKTRPVDIREDVNAIEKVSDQYTPPSDAGIPDDLYGKSSASVAISSPANTPPVEPGFSARNSFKARSPPTSPPQHKARPLSFGSGIPPVPSYPRYPLSNYSSPPAPPAPHLPQPHFYGAPDIDLGLPNIASKAGPRESHFSKFIKLPYADTGRNHGVVTGHEIQLHICSFDGVASEEIGALHNLPGKVVDAEMLTWNSGPDPLAHLRPLLAITLMHFEHAEAGVSQYRTSVAVYSLSRQLHLLDLLVTAPQSFQPVVSSAYGSSSDPCNSLRLKAVGNYLAAASAKSGEIFVFTPILHESGPTFECLGKFWTSIQPREQPRGSSHNRLGQVDASSHTSRKIKEDENVPILSLSGRWLAICPPSTSSLQTAGIVLGERVVAGRQAGLEALSAPSRPTINCNVDSPDADTLLGKVARGVAQEVMKAGKWLGEQGMQAWQNYWKKDDLSDQAFPHAPYMNQPHHTQAAYGQFPPTHADARTVTNDPELVSIYDLKLLHDSPSRKSNVIVPLVTFQPPHGCSFLSFSPHGLMLLSASRKGDYQYVWDLLEMKHGRTLFSDLEVDASPTAPRVRQLARFDRLSGSTIVDMVWDLSAMSRFALLTKNKTIHLFDLPASALRWPPPRRAKKSRPISAPPNSAPAVETNGPPAGGFFASAMNFAGKTQPVFANLRGRTPSASGGLAGIGQAGFGIATATGVKGSKVVATGLSKSLGAATETMNRMQHAGENRLHLKSEKEAFAGRMVWMRRTSKPGLVILGESGLKSYQVRKSKARDPRQRDATIFDARRAISIKLPNFSSESSSQHPTGECFGAWKSEPYHTDNLGNVHPLSFAEIETNAAFQPFHSDKRVTLSIFSQNVSRPTRSVTWAFGDDIPAIRLNVTPAGDFDDEESGSVIYRETTLSSEARGGEQIVSTTRRRKPKRGASAREHEAAVEEDLQQEGFFEDDCDVLDFASDRV